MNEVQIQLDDGRTSFRPGEMIRGQIDWSVESAPKSIDVRLVWSTSGKGTQNVGVAESHPIAPLRTAGHERFEFRAPEGPYSFSGQLISLIWAIEIEIQKKLGAGRQEIVISPSGSEISLQASLG